MKRKMLFFFLILLFTWGCSTHYYKTRDKSVYIYLKKSGADQVFFLCSIDGYQYHEARKINPKTWEVEIPENREFRYFYIVDGETFIPDCRFKEIDDFGSHNCVYEPYL